MSDASDNTNLDAFIDVQLHDGPVDAVAFDPFPQPAGAECVFLGRTRCETHPEHGELTELAYEAYAPLAQSSLEELAREAVTQFKCLAVRLHHAVGVVPPGDASVLVQVVCGHRGESFDACRFLIDRLKQVTPIWKREVWADGTSWSTGQAVQLDDETTSPEAS